MNLFKFNLINALKNLIKNDKIILLGKAMVFTVLLSLARGHWLFFIVFLSAASYFYLRPSLNTGQFSSSFLVLMACSIFLVRFLFLSSSLSFLIACFFGFLLFLILGIKNLIFIRREPVYYFLNGLLILSIFVFFFRSEDASGLFFIEYLVLFAALLLLLKEFLIFSLSGLPHSAKRNLIICGTAFLIVQLLWAINLLPINFLNAASLVLLMTLILQDFVIQYFKGTINRQVILRNTTVFLVLALIIFGASNWAP